MTGEEINATNPSEGMLVQNDDGDFITYHFGKWLKINDLIKDNDLLGHHLKSLKDIEQKYYRAKTVLNDISKIRFQGVMEEAATLAHMFLREEEL